MCLQKSLHAYIFCNFFYILFHIFRNIYNPSKIGLVQRLLEKFVIKGLIPVCIHFKHEFYIYNFIYQPKRFCPMNKTSQLCPRILYHHQFYFQFFFKKIWLIMLQVSIYFNNFRSESGSNPRPEMTEDKLLTT